MEDLLILTNDTVVLIIDELDYESTRQWCQTNYQFRQKCNLNYWLHQIRIDFDLTPEQASDLISHKPDYVTLAVYYKWLKMWLDKMSVDNFKKVVKEGLLPVVKLYRYKSKGFSGDAFRLAARIGHLEMSQWLYNLGGVNIHADNDYSFRWAVLGGHLDVAQWIYSLGGVDIHSHNDYVFRRAAEYGHLDVAKWLYSLGNVDIHADDDYAIRYAAAQGRLDVIQWLYSLGGFRSRVMRNAAETAEISGHTDVVNWLNSQRSKCIIS